jgi:acyl-CoA thioesterase-1
MQVNNPVRTSSEGHAMGGHDQSRPPVGMHVEEQLDDTFTVFRIKVARRFVGKNYFRFIYQSPTDSNTLLFSTGELFREIPTPVAKSDPLKKHPRLIEGLDIFFQFGREHDIFNAVQGWNEMKGLKDKTGNLVTDRRQLVFAQIGYIIAGYVDFSTARPVKTGQHTQQGGFTAAAAAGYNHELALFYSQGDVLEHGDLLPAKKVMFREFFGCENSLGHTLPVIIFFRRLHQVQLFQVTLLSR